jgi:hypothetical protein
MSLDITLPMAAFGIGTFQMYQTFNKIKKTGDLSGHKRNYVILSIIASLFLVDLSIQALRCEFYTRIYDAWSRLGNLYSS